MSIPSNISTSSLQKVGNDYLKQINSKLNEGSNTISNSLCVNIASDQTVPISASSLPLPSGASTSALQTTGNNILTTISGQLPATLGAKTIANSMAVNIASDQVLPISISSIALPTGASTSALQTTGNTTLTTISGQLPASLGTKLIADSLAVNLASDQTLPINITSIALPTGASTAALQTTGNTTLTTISGQLPSSLGSKLIAASLAVNIASDQTVPISAASLPLPSGASTSALQTTGNTTLTTISGQLPSSLGTKLIAASLAVNIASDQTVPISAASLPLPSGASTSSLQTSGNATLTTISGQLPSALGTKTIANSMAVNIASDQTVPVAYGDSPSIDGFGRLRVSNPTTITASKLLVDNNPLYWSDQQFSGSGTSSTYNTNQASVTLSVSNTTAGNRIRQQKVWANYEPGKSQLIFITFNMNGLGGTGITKNVGYFNSQNGIFLSSSSSVLSFKIRTYTSGSAVDTTVNQSSWNVDALNGSGPSGITLDMTKTQILIIDFEWLGVGRIRCGFVIDGIIYYAHYFNNANSNTLVYMSNPNLPVGYQIINSGSGAAATLTCICNTIISEGGSSLVTYTRSIDRGTTALTVTDATETVLAVMRLKSTALMASVNIISGIVISTSTSAFLVRLSLNPTLSGSPTYVSLANSAIEYDTTTTTITVSSSGTDIYSDYSNQGTGTGTPGLNLSNCRIYLGSNVDGTRDILVLSVIRISGTTETYYAALNFIEVI